MKQSTVEQILLYATDYANQQKKWHFHILTPDCQLNDTDTYALVLENTSDNESFVCYSDRPYMGIGEKLVKLLHGDDVMKKDHEEKLPPSPKVKMILKRAQKLTESGIFWHHHMLFPGCVFNRHEGKYVIVFEDFDRNEIIESISDSEPKSDLQHIEALFYSQKQNP